MDFDELDELAPVAENRQPSTGTVLDWMARSSRMPGLSTHLHILPEMLQKQIPPHVREAVVKGERREKVAKVRLLCVHGVSDSYKQDWFMLEAEAPPEIEVAVHEFPGHGHREKEPVLSSIRELADDAFEAFRDAMETGSFALLGHSIGCLVITELAKRAEAELHVKPVAVFMVERGACQWPLFTAKGMEALQDKELTVALNVSTSDDRGLELREKELEDGRALLIVSGTSSGLFAAWNASHPNEEVRLYDEVVRVNGAEASSAKALRAAAEAAVEASEEVRIELRRRPYDFLGVYMPDVAKMFQNGPTKALDRWQRSWRCENDTMEVGYHTFSCPLVAISAEGSVECTLDLLEPCRWTSAGSSWRLVEARGGSWRLVEVRGGSWRLVEDLTPDIRKMIDFGGKVFNKELGDGKGFLGHFPRDTFEDWARWTENEGGFKVVECEGCSHMSIKSSKKFKDTVFNTLSDLVKLWSRT